MNNNELFQTFWQVRGVIELKHEHQVKKGDVLVTRDGRRFVVTLSKDDDNNVHLKQKDMGEEFSMPIKELLNCELWVENIKDSTITKDQN